MATNDCDSTPVFVPAERLEPVSALYKEGLYLQAYRVAEEMAPLRRWTGTAARVLAGRLAGNLGGLRPAYVHFLRAWRADPQDARACCFYARYLADRYGPWRGWQFLKQRGDIPEASAEDRSHWYTLHADVLGRVRDFDAADRWLARAEEIDADNPWTHLSRAVLCSQQDRHEEALQEARQALAIRPGDRSTVQWLAHFLVQKEEDDEAETLLVDACKKLESCAVWAQLANLQMERGKYAEARASLVQAERLAPLKDKDMAQWLAARRADAAYYCGDLEEALAFARQVKGKFFETLAARLQEPPPARRVFLPVPFVRQHFDTCAPATLAAICRFWSMPGDHLEMAAAITYAGTPNHSERRWAEDNGWATREFTVTWDSAVAVLDQGIPFTLTTPEPNGSHLQAVIGYDNRRGTLLVRDPNERHQVEFLASALEERYRATGPRGLALVPRGESERLARLDLPDAELYDLRYQLDQALEAHQRERAGELCRQLEAKAPEHPITHWARRTLAAYDQDTAGELASLEKLLERFPDDLCLQLGRVWCLRDLARRNDCLAQLQKLCEQKNTHPTCWQQYAQDLADDAREHPQAVRWLKRALRHDPRDARCYNGLARIAWTQRKLDEALELSRFAACLEEKDEFFSRAYFANARALGRSEEALRFLRERFTRFGKKSGFPARTLSWAYFQLERTADGFAVLDEALGLRPDDGDLLLFAVDQWMFNGEFDRAEELLQRAQGRARASDWLRSAARLKKARGDLRGARALWAQVLEVQPLASDAQSAYAHLLAETDGRQAALGHIEQACARFPHNFPLHRLWLDWLYEDGAPAREPVVRRLIDIHPADGWAHRELALILADQLRLDEALAELDIAARIEPECVPLHTVRAYVLERLGRVDEAKECYRAALKLSADSDLAINEWMALCDTQAERRAALAFVEEEMKRQVLMGDGLLAFREAGLITFEREELLDSLRRALDARPDLWQAWAAVIRQLRSMERLDEALEVAKQAVERFPLLPALWVDLADVHEERQEEDQAARALARALRINPDWNVPLRRLTSLYERQGRAARAKTLLRKAIARAPLLAENHYTLALLLWNAGQQEQAFARARHTLTLDASFVAAWDALLDWGPVLGRSAEVLAYAREVSQQRSGEARSWMRLAEALERITDLPDLEPDARVREAIEALDRAIALNPRLVEAYDRKAVLLAEQSRFRAAEAACLADVWNGRPPLILRGRLAWLAAQRGRLNQAIRVMRTAVAEDPTYAWGWRMLADWLDNQGKTKAHAHAAEQLVLLTPDDPMAWAHRADARRRLGDLEGARADYERALEMSPGYVYVAFHIFDLSLEARDFKRARSVLRTIKSSIAPGDYHSRAVRLSVAAAQPDAACKHLARLCGNCDGDQTLIAETAAHLEEAGWERECEKVLWDNLAQGQAVSKHWVETVRRRDSWRAVVRRVERLPSKDRRKGHAVYAVAEALARAGKGAAACSLVKRHEEVLRRDTFLWGMVGHLFSLLLEDRRTVAWLRDWRERTEVSSWMLVNLALALTSLERWDEAQEVHRHALEHAEEDYTRPYHEAWLALGAALAGNLSAVRDFFARCPQGDLDANHQWIAALARAVLLAHAGRDKTSALARARKHLRQTAERLEPIDRDNCFLVAYRLASRCIAEQCGQKWGSSKGLVPRRKKGVPA